MKPGTPLGPLDHGYLRYEARHAGIRGDIAVLARIPGQDEVREFLADRVAALPELALTVDRPAARWRRPRWTRVEVDLDRQFREVRVPEGGRDTAVEEVMAERLPTDRPLWQVVLIREPRARWLLCRAHHALFDGVAMAQACAQLFGGELVPGTDSEPTARWRALATIARGIPGYLRRYFPLAGKAFNAEGYTGGRRVAWTSFEAERVYAVARRHGVTPNDVYLAVLAGALRQWPHTPWRDGVREVWAMVPFDVRATDGGQDVVNREVNLRISLNCAEPDPRRRLHEISRACAEERTKHLATMQLAVRELPAWLVRLLFRLTFSRRHIDLAASNTGWLGARPEYRGGVIEDVLSITALPHDRPLGTVLGTYGDRMFFHVASDSSLPRGDVLCRLWLQELNTLAALPPLPGKARSTAGSSR